MKHTLIWERKGIVKKQGIRGMVGILAAVMLTMVLAPPAYAQGYTFTKVADSVGDAFDPSRSRRERRRGPAAP